MIINSEFVCVKSVNTIIITEELGSGDLAHSG